MMSPLRLKLEGDLVKFIKLEDDFDNKRKFQLVKLKTTSPARSKTKSRANSSSRAVHRRMRRLEREIDELVQVPDVVLDFGWTELTLRRAGLPVMRYDAKQRRKVEIYGELTKADFMTLEALLKGEPKPRYLGEGRITLGKQEFPLRASSSHVIEALLDGPLTMDELVSRSGHGDAVKIFKRLKVRFPLLSPYLVTPGGRDCGGYRVHIDRG